MKTSTTRKILTGVAVATSIMFAQSAIAKDGDVQAGVLECDVQGGVGLILGSKKKMTCTFTKSDGSVEEYTGRVTKIGVDIGITKKSKIVWAVLAPSKTTEPGALAGNYNGVAAEATIVGGIGSVYGAVLGGFIVGIATNMALLVLPSGYSPAMPFVIILVLLLVRPNGLFGETQT